MERKQFCLVWQLNLIIMKKIIIFLVCIFLISCSKDDDNNTQPQSNNSLIINGEEYELKLGTIENLGSYEGSIFDFVLNLTSSDFTVNDGFSFEDDIVTSISIDLYVNSPSDLVVGDYPKVSFDNITGNSFQAMDFLIEYDIENETGTTKQIIDGTLKVLSVGDQYKFEFSGVDNDGLNVSFNYKGNLVEL